MEHNPQKDRGLDGLRVYAGIGIIMWHVFANATYDLSGYFFESVLPTFSRLAYLFMVISGYSMCCGYFHKITNREITVGEFYGRRYAKIFPFFAVLCLAEFALAPTLVGLYEVIANLTLCFGFLPLHNTSIIGVGWFLGVLFVFYFIFPFFCYLMEKKWRGWLAFGLSWVLSYLCRIYFFTKPYMGITIYGGKLSKMNFLYCAPFFLAGGILFLYRDKLKWFVRKFWYLVLLLCGGAVTLLYTVKVEYAYEVAIPTFMCLVTYAIGVKWKGVLHNPVTKFLGQMSLELYLCHMAAFRILELMGLLHIFQSPLMSFIATVLFTLILSIGITYAIRGGFWLLKKGWEYLKAKRTKQKETIQEE